jgi:hypothetical protein
VAADDQERHLRAILRASERVRAAEATLGQRREDYREAIAAAHSAGVSLAAIGRRSA